MLRDVTLVGGIVDLLLNFRQCGGVLEKMVKDYAGHDGRGVAAGLDIGVGPRWERPEKTQSAVSRVTIRSWHRLWDFERTIQADRDSFAFP